MHALARVLFEVRADDADLLGLEATLGIADLEPAVVAERQIVLTDLIALGQVGIVILLAIPLGELGDLAIERHGRAAAEQEGFAIHHRQCARHADADGAGLGVGGRAEFRAAAAEELGAREELHMHFQADHDGIRFCHGTIPLTSR